MQPVLKGDTELRAFDFELRAEQNEEHGAFLEGVPIVFNQRTALGFYDEIIDAHALDKTDLRDVRFLINHNTDMTPLARSRNNNANSTMQMQVQEDGLHIRVNLDIENNSDAKNLYSAVKRGDVSGMSFMFSVRSDDWSDLDSEHPTRNILDIGRVFEVSAVTFPAYEQTSINARSKEALESAKAALESALAEKRQKEAEIQERKDAENRRARQFALYDTFNER